MPFRADDNALKARKEALERALREIRDAQGQFDAPKQSEAERVKELADVESTKRALPLLDKMRIAAPCHVPWESMKGDEHVRFCSSCAKNVYDLSALTSHQAEALLRAKEGNLCVTYFKRADGTVLSADCPVGLRRRRLRNAVIAIAAAAGAAATFGAHPGKPPPDVAKTLVRAQEPSEDKTIIVIIDPKGAEVIVDGQTKMKADTGAIGFAGPVGSAHTVTVSSGGRSLTESIVIAAEDGHQYKVALPPLPRKEEPLMRVVGLPPPPVDPHGRPQHRKVTPPGAMD